ncbi:MAG: DUF433 domain-containing protein [Oscillatoriaceae cyanobacterium Prado104]|jgi:uncharacterized protein (DUF433 family)|nr:DUF433 domain-containing protein [Oscillatoriaceae cyanobacterium Prado104]
MQNLDLFEVIERHPSKVSGAWVFRGTRVPVAAFFENLKDGASVDQFLEWFPGVTRTQVEVLLDRALASLTQITQTSRYRSTRKAAGAYKPPSHSESPLKEN